LIAEMSHETNTFSPVPTDLARFGGGLPGSGAVPLSGTAVEAAYEGTHTGVGAFLELAAEAGADVVTPISASAPPSGIVQDDAYEYICDAICSSVAETHPDAIMLCLHGAMAVESTEDGEGELLRRIRAIAPDTPVAITLDMHCNFYDEIAKYANTVAGYHTYPHEDMYETALRAGRPLLAMMAGECQPVTSWGNRRMLPHIMRQSTLDPYPGREFKTPNKAIQARCLQMETSGDALIASVFVGFPHADIENAGLSAVVVTDGDEAQAAKLRDELLEMAWASRADWVFEHEPLSDSIARAQEMATADDEDKPVILLDHYDNTASGGTMDTTTVLSAVLEAGLDDVVFYGIFDPAAVETMAKAGVGATVSLSLGGKMDMPAIGLKGEPVEVKGEVITLKGQDETTSSGRRGGAGPSAVLRVGDRVDICVISRHVEPNNLGCMKDLDIDATTRKYLVLKSRVHWQNSRGFGPIYKGVVECDGTGVCGSDYSEMTFENVRRPIYPLEVDADPLSAAEKEAQAITAPVAATVATEE
jgi:microcystin degradation protein MlrC